MGGNYSKDIYKQLMEIMERCDSLEKDLKSAKSSSKTQIHSLNSEIKHLDSKCNKLEAENAALRQEVDSLTEENISLKKENWLLKEEIIHLNSVADNNSDNSSLPPSSDEKPYKKKANEYNGRTASGKKSGGQKEHPGTMLSRKLIEERVQSGSLGHTVENWVNGALVSDVQAFQTRIISPIMLWILKSVRLQKNSVFMRTRKGTTISQKTISVKWSMGIRSKYWLWIFTVREISPLKGSRT